MRTDQIVQCIDFPCLDTRRSSYLIPHIDIDPAKVSILLISEASPENPSDYYYAGPEALFARTTAAGFPGCRGEGAISCRTCSIWAFT